jgi:hypothetical protein
LLMSLNKKPMIRVSWVFYSSKILKSEKIKL